MVRSYRFHQNCRQVTRQSCQTGLQYRHIISFSDKSHMSTLVRGNRDLIRAMNRTLLLNIIRRERSVARRDLTDISGLSVGAVSGIVSELLEQGWLLEQEDDEETGGR